MLALLWKQCCRNNNTWCIDENSSDVEVIYENVTFTNHPNKSVNFY